MCFTQEQLLFFWPFWSELSKHSSFIEINSKGLFYDIALTLNVVHTYKMLCMQCQQTGKTHTQDVNRLTGRDEMDLIQYQLWGSSPEHTFLNPPS